MLNNISLENDLSHLFKWTMNINFKNCITPNMQENNDHKNKLKSIGDILT